MAETQAQRHDNKRRHQNESVNEPGRAHGKTEGKPKRQPDGKSGARDYELRYLFRKRHNASSTSLSWFQTALVELETTGA